MILDLFSFGLSSNEVKSFEKGSCVHRTEMILFLNESLQKRRRAEKLRTSSCCVGFFRRFKQGRGTSKYVFHPSFPSSLPPSPASLSVIEVRLSDEFISPPTSTLTAAHHAPSPFLRPLLHGGVDESQIKSRRELHIQTVWFGYCSFFSTFVIHMCHNIANFRWVGEMEARGWERRRGFRAAILLSWSVKSRNRWRGRNVTA